MVIKKLFFTLRKRYQIFTKNTSINHILIYNIITGYSFPEMGLETDTCFVKATAQFINANQIKYLRNIFYCVTY